LCWRWRDHTLSAGVFLG